MRPSASSSAPKRSCCGWPGIHVWVEASSAPASRPRPALALAPVLAPARRLGAKPAAWQRQPRPGVGELEAVLLGGLPPQVLDEEVWVALEPGADRAG